VQRGSIAAIKGVIASMILPIFTGKNALFSVCEGISFHKLILRE
jgi:hypothetical protein